MGGLEVISNLRGSYWTGLLSINKLMLYDNASTHLYFDCREQNRHVLILNWRKRQNVLELFICLSNLCFQTLPNIHWYWHVAGLSHWCFCIVYLVWFFMPWSTAMVMSGWSVHLTTLFFLVKLDKAVYQYNALHAHTFACDWQQLFLNQRNGGKWP